MPQRFNAKTLIICTLLCGCATTLPPGAIRNTSELRVSPLFSEGAVLQRDQPITIWGSAPEGSVVRVKLGPRRGQAVAHSNGRWEVHLPAIRAGGPHTLRVLANGKAVRINNIMIGNVYLVAGAARAQSPVHIADAALHDDQLRLLRVPWESYLLNPGDIGYTSWTICDGAPIGHFSAIAVQWGRDMRARDGVPIGIIQATRTGTNTESWLSPKVLKATMSEPAWKKSQHDGAAAILSAIMYRDAAARWFASLEGDDAGYEGRNARWAVPDLDDSAWPEMDAPGIWSGDLASFDGAIWFRKRVTLPRHSAGRDLDLSLSLINDCDRTWFNGVLVGKTEYDGAFQATRHYRVPGALVKRGENVIAVRILDIGLRGGFYGAPEDMALRFRDESIPLFGPWRYKKGYALPPVPPKPEGMRPPYIGPGMPGVVYNGMIAPLTPLALRGVIWVGDEDIDNDRVLSDWRDQFKSTQTIESK